ncbi:hypothetical protein [Fusibacter tunisiensis]|nr:hypothetical protein [Fusibacter tunisiensis]
MKEIAHTLLSEQINQAELNAAIGKYFYNLLEFDGIKLTNSAIYKTESQILKDIKSGVNLENIVINKGEIVGIKSVIDDITYQGYPFLILEKLTDSKGEVVGFTIWDNRYARTIPKSKLINYMNEIGEKYPEHIINGTYPTKKITHLLKIRMGEMHMGPLGVNHGINVSEVLTGTKKTAYNCDPIELRMHVDQKIVIIDKVQYVLRGLNQVYTNIQGIKTLNENEIQAGVNAIKWIATLKYDLDIVEAAFKDLKENIEPEYLEQILNADKFNSIINAMLKNSIHYNEDLKDQFGIEIENNYNGKHTWEGSSNSKKFLMYKDKAKSLKVDCDVSPKAIVHYTCGAYSWLDKRDVVVQNENSKILDKKTNEAYRGDTMTSAWNFFRYAIQLADNYQKVIIDDLKIEGSLSNHFDKLISIIDNLKWDKDDALTGLKDQLDIFARNCHTFGNMIPVPLYFNNERSGHFANRDCWDITMVALYGWYQDNETLSDVNFDLVALDKDRWLLGLFSGSGNEAKVFSVINCKKWLCKMGSWSNFIAMNKLESFTGEYDTKKVPKTIINNMPLSFDILDRSPDEFFKKTWEKFKPGNGKHVTNWEARDKKNLVNYLRNLNISIAERNDALNHSRKEL